MNIFRIDAVYLIHPETKSSDDGGFYDGNGDKITLDESAVSKKETELKSAHEAKKYQRDRADAYPELREQLDLLWHAIDGGKFNVKSKETDFYKKLKAVKDANPKPE